jgi:hypothetical protein
MFLKCTSLVGAIPADLFTGTSNQKLSIESLNYLFAGCTRLATHFSNQQYSAGTTLVFPALDEDAPKTRYCSTYAGNFATVYPHVVRVRTKGEDGNDILQKDLYQPDEDVINNFTDSDARYLVPRDWLACVTGVKTIKHIFSCIGTFDIFTQDTQEEFTFNQTEGGALILKIPETLFNGFNITDASYAFCANASIGKTDIGKNFLLTSMQNNKLQDISYIFAESRLQNIVYNNENNQFLVVGVRNDSLTNINYAFSYTNQIDYKYYSPGSEEQLTNTGFTNKNFKVVDFLNANLFKKIPTGNTYTFDGNSAYTPEPYKSGGDVYSRFVGNTSNPGYAIRQAVSDINYQVSNNKLSV